MRNGISIMKIYFYLVVIWFLAMVCFSLVGCKTEIPKAEAVNPTVIVEDKKLPVLAWGDKAEWTAHLLSELEGKDFLAVTPKDFKDWCPNFPVLTTPQRAEFYAQLVSIMAKRESGFNPDTKYQESFKDGKGKPVISRGLLQISQESANSYGCGIDKAEKLHSPKINLSCGVKIIQRWVNRDQRLGGKLDTWKGCARYWSVCRSISRSYPIVTGYTKSLPICKTL